MAKTPEVYSYTIDRSGIEKEMIVDCKQSLEYPSIEDSEVIMQKVLTFLVEAGRVDKINLSSDRNYTYTDDQVSLLNEIREVYIYLVKEKEVVSDFTKNAPKTCPHVYSYGLGILQNIVHNLLMKDPLGAYVETKRKIREAKIKLEGENKKDCKECYSQLMGFLEDIKEALFKTKIVEKVKNKLAGYRLGDRKIYRELFEPMIRPNFMYTRLMAQRPLNGKEIDSYVAGGDVDVTIYKIPEKTRFLYHVTPPELKLNDDDYRFLTQARNVLVKYSPEKEEFINPDRMREVFKNISKDLLEQIAKESKVKISYKQLQNLSNILVKLTVGFGIIEELLKDDRIEDIYINAPIGFSPIFIKHADYGECVSNIIPNYKEVTAWASRFRMISGRPLDEANPVLDTELEVPGIARARIAFIQEPLSSKGSAIAIRRHREKPFTLPMYLKFKMFSPLAGGLLWFLIDGSRTLLVAGTRGAGKTALLGSVMVQIMKRFRIITIEDTLELPTNYLRKMGYDILSLKVRSAILGERSELSAEDGIRTSLRLGDSALIVGEVRSTEAKALYESMRVGALANVVAGTIHGDSPYGVFDRVVNDLGVPITSFKATDIIAIANKVRSPDGMREYRRLTSITEVRKHWTQDPLREQGFVDLMKYNPYKDIMEPTKELLEGESEIVKSIASNVKEWIGNWDRVLANIKLRGDIIKMIHDYHEKTGKQEILEADFVTRSNDVFHRIFEKLQEETGYPEPKDVKTEFEKWLRQKIKKEM